MHKETKWQFEQIVPKSNGELIERLGHTGTVMFVNLGPTTAYINEIPLLSNSSMSLDGNTESIDTTSWRVQADIPTGKLGVWMIRQVYTGRMRKAEGL